MKKHYITKALNYVRECVSDFITDAVGTWSFVIFYSILILGWILANETKILNYDTDLTYLNFFLCWLSGIQASIVMMSDSRKEEKHTAISEKTLISELKSKEIIQKMSKKVTSMINKISKLEEIIELMEQEEEEKINAKSTKFRGDN